MKVRSSLRALYMGDLCAEYGSTVTFDDIKQLFLASGVVETGEAAQKYRYSLRHEDKLDE